VIRLPLMEAFPLDAAKAQLSELVDRVTRDQDRVAVTREGKPAAVLISQDELEGLEQTLEIISDPAEVAGIRDGLAALVRGDTVPLERLKADLGARRAAEP
jgi:antitoxin YefM